MRMGFILCSHKGGYYSLQSIFSEKPLKFLLRCVPAMMCRLICDIINNSWFIWFTNGKYTISLLPWKALIFRMYCLYPLTRIWLNWADEFRDALRDRKWKQYVYMVRSATYYVCMPGYRLYDSPDILKHPRQMLLAYGDSCGFCMENDMNVNIRIGVCHIKTVCYHVV